MRVDMDLDFDKQCRVGLSPTTVLPLNRRCSNVENRSRRTKLTRRDELLTIDEEFTEISFGRYRSNSCRSIPTRPVDPDGNSELRRGSVYQSSREVRNVKKTGHVEVRKKIEISHVSDRSSDMLKTCVCKPHTEEPCSSNGFFEIRLNLNEENNSSAKNAERDFSVDTNLGCDQVIAPRNDGNELLEIDSGRSLHKSLSAKLENCESRTSQKSRFSPIRRMFDPFTKSKSMRRPLGSSMEHEEIKSNGTSDNRTNGSFRKSLLNDFSNAEQTLESQIPSCKKDIHCSITTRSPAHLNACLKVENKNGLLFFEFSVNCPEEVFVAKIWKLDDASKWVYTFHSIHSRMKNNFYGRISKDKSNDSTVVGQMQVSCYLSSKLKEGDFENTMISEFVLYDIAHAIKNISAQDSPNCLPNILTQAYLHQNLEIAAIVMEVPFEKRESLKNKKGDNINDKDMAVKICQPKMKIVTPSGIHGLPKEENRGPSSLLNRWRLNGGCDCGGWDMACPLTVFCNSSIQTMNQWPLEVHVKGGKENIPALAITVVEAGQYAVDFHAQLSTLQAFSICVAILHSSETATCSLITQDRKKPILPCNSLKELIEDEVKHLTERVTEEKKMKDISASFVPNPPFSPMSRV